MLEAAAEPPAHVLHSHQHVVAHLRRSSQVLIRSIRIGIASRTTIHTSSSCGGWWWGAGVAGQKAPLPQALAASQVARSAGPVKSSRASAKASSCSRGRALIWAVVASVRGPQRRLSWRRVIDLLLLAGGLPQGEFVQQEGEIRLPAQGLKVLHLRLQRREEVVKTLLMSSRGHHTCTTPTPHRRWAHIQARSQSRESTLLKVQGCFH